MGSKSRAMVPGAQNWLPFNAPVGRWQIIVEEFVKRLLGESINCFARPPARWPRLATRLALLAGGGEGTAAQPPPPPSALYTHYLLLMWIWGKSAPCAKWRSIYVRRLSTTLCGGCRKVVYCGENCMGENWELHGHRAACYGC